MEFRYSAEDEQFRQEVCSWLERELPPGFTEKLGLSEEDDEYFAFEEVMRKKLAAKGWLTTWWPVEYGGKGWSLWRQVVFNEELAAHGLAGIGGHAVYTVGPSIILHGTEEQKRKHLTAIARGEGIYWIGFTEPNAGSDLASLQLKAERDGEEFVLNGEKTYIGDSRHGDYIYLATRTDPTVPKHQGITIFLVDLHTPGISFWPLQRLGGGIKNRITFDDVCVPATDIIGELNRGWFIIHDTLNLDRAGRAGFYTRDRLEFQAFLKHCKETPYHGRPLSEEPEVQDKLARIYTEIELYRLLEWRVVWMRSREMPVTHQSSMSALYHKRLGPHWAATRLEIAGLYGLLTKGSKWAPMEGRIEHALRESLFTHGGGTPEIQKNIMAIRGLVLPKS